MTITHLVVVCEGCWKAVYPHATVIRVDDPNNREIIERFPNFQEAAAFTRQYNENAWQDFKNCNPDAVRGDI